jgi:hypothetical protein
MAFIVRIAKGAAPEREDRSGHENIFREDICFSFLMRKVLFATVNAIVFAD